VADVIKLVECKLGEDKNVDLEVPAELLVVNAQPLAVNDIAVKSFEYLHHPLLQ
jgi:hypothetical protein